ncbi:MAG: acyl-CoA dehydrogenase family protein [Gammaproteobacteria bacterium]|nr:acyl-CoA dehydrogenase family protein [Gammaproteobacteria bacterium]
MIDFGLTAEQRALLETTRRYVDSEVRPAAAAQDRNPDPAHGFSADLVRKGMAIGLGHVLVPQEYGGYGGGLLDYSLIIEELARGDAGIADVFLVNVSLSRLLLRGCNATQRERWLPAFCADPDFLLAGPMTEPAGGSEIFCPLPDPTFGVRTTAVREGDAYVLNGTKCFISNGGLAGLYIVLARTDRNAPNLGGCSIFLVPARTPGLGFGKIEDKMGHRLSVVREVLFEDCRVPLDCRMGEEGQGFQILLDCYEGNGVGIGSAAIGLARAAYDAAVEYAQQRVVWGQPIITHESVAAKLAQMRMNIEAARALVWKIAWAVENPDRGEGLNKLGTMAKILPSAMVREVTVAAMDVFGGAGFMRDNPIEKYVRDAMVFPIYDGTNDVLTRFLAMRLPEVPSSAY